MTQVHRAWLALGIAGPLLIVAGFFAVDAGGTTPADGLTRLLVADLLADPQRRVIGSAIGMAGALLLVPFAAAIRYRLRAAAPIDSTVLGFGVLITAGALVHGAFRLSIGSVGNETTTAQAARALVVLEPVGLIVMTWALAAFVLATAYGAVHVRLIPAWMAALGLALVVAALAFSASDRGGFSILLLLWLAIASTFTLAGAQDGQPQRRMDAATDRR